MKNNSNKKNKVIKKRKISGGFTLVELLATLAILSLVSVIVMYTATNVINNAKEKSYLVTINNIQKESGTYVLENDKNIMWLGDGNDYVYQCVTVQNLIDMGYFDNNILDSKVSENRNVLASDYIYIEKDNETKTITKQVLLYDDTSDLRNLCGDYINAKGIINFYVPDGWAQSKDVTITYELNASIGDSDNYIYSYEYTDESILPGSGAFTTSRIAVKKITVHNEGTMLAHINQQNGKNIVSSSADVTGIDTFGPKITEDASSDEARGSVTIPIRITDRKNNSNGGCNNNSKENCGSGIDKTTVKKGNFIVNIGSEQLSDDDYSLSDENCFDVNGDDTIDYCNYNLNIKNYSYAGEVVIIIPEKKIFDNVGNPNVATELNTGITFDNTYKIKYYANGGSGSMSDTICTYGKDCSLSENKFTRKGYTFVGWSEDSNAKNASYDKSYKYTPDLENEEEVKAEIKLYAIWKANTVTVKFNVNGGTIQPSTTYKNKDYTWATDSKGLISRTYDGETSKEFYKLDYGSSDDLPNPAGPYMKVTRSEYTVWEGLEWECSSGNCIDQYYDDQTDYSASQYCNIDTSDCTIELKVRWKPYATCPTITAYDGTYDAKSHSITVTGGSGGTIQYSTDDTNWSTTKPKRTAAGTTTVYVKVVGDENHNTRTCESSTINVNKKALTITANAQTVNYGTSITKNVNKVSVDGLLSAHSLSEITLTQSTTEATTNGTITPSAAKIINTSAKTEVTSNYDIKYETGKLTINRYKVTIYYKVDGGSVENKHETKGYDDDSSGYITYKDGNTTKRLVTEILYKAPMGQYGLTNYNNKNNFIVSKTGYHVESGKEWCLSTDCKNKVYSQADYEETEYDSDDFCDASEKDCKVILQVNWKPNTYTIKYNACSGTNAPSDQTKTYGVDLPLSSTKPTRDGYTFEGWSDAESCAKATSKKYAAGDTYKTNASDTLYAVWKTNDTTSPTCTISATANSTTITGTCSDNSGSCAYYGWNSSYSGANSNTKTVTGIGTETFYVKDAAGNIGSCSATITNTNSSSCPAGYFETTDGTKCTKCTQSTPVYKGTCGCAAYYSGGKYYNARQGGCGANNSCDCGGNEEYNYCYTDYSCSKYDSIAKNTTYSCDTGQIKLSNSYCFKANLNIVGDGQLSNIVNTSDTCTTSGQKCPVGTRLNIQVNSSTAYDFYVIGDTGTTITLLKGNTNVVSTKYKWGDSLATGPKTILSALDTATSGWDNIPTKSYTISDSQNSKYTAITVSQKARLLTLTEAKNLGCEFSTTGSCPSYFYNKATNQPFWLSETLKDGSSYYPPYIGGAGQIGGGIVTSTTTAGVRPVIELTK